VVFCAPTVAIATPTITAARLAVRKNRMRINPP
jgi:hypothetical protein